VRIINPRERIRTALNHKEPDILPIDFGGMRSTGIHAIAYNRLVNYLGFKNKKVKVYDIFQQLAEPDMEIIDLLGGDVVQAHRLCPAFGISIESWKESKLQDGSDCLVPENFKPVVNEYGDYDIIQGNIVIARMPRKGLYFDQIYRPYAQAETTVDIDRVPIDSMTNEEIEFLKEGTKKLHMNIDKAVLMAYGGNIFEAGQINFGYEKFYIDIALNKRFMHYYFEKLTENYLNELSRLLPVVSEYIDLIQFGDDLGTQIAPQISVEMYREMIKPYHKRIYRYVRDTFPNLKVFLHCCGAISNYIPDLIDVGVEVINPVQISARGMDPQKLKKEFGKDLTFWGGGANMQETVVKGTIQDIKDEVRRLIEIFSPGGGYVFNQVHNIQANIEPEKIMAIYETAKEYRK